jgi:hypothetical protein
MIGLGMTRQIVSARAIWKYIFIYTMYLASNISDQS